MSGFPRGAWPVQLRSGDIVVRPLRLRDQTQWREVRARNRAWLKRWDGTSPPGASAPYSFADMVREGRRHAKQGRMMPFAIIAGGRFAGQVTLNNVVRGGAQFASIGYWIDQAYAGRGIMPRVVALVIDHAFTAAGLHRVEVAIRPENKASLRVVEKLGIAEIGYAPRFLHIDGDWRDHRLFAVTVEEVGPGGLRRRLEPSAQKPSEG